MADNFGATGNMCRFCLCRDGLISFSEATSSALTFEDVQYYTGIELSADEEFVLCNDCCVSINESANYRRTCLRNDTIFERLVRLRNRSALASATITRAPAEVASVQGAEFTVITVAENHAISLDDSESNDVSSLSQEVNQDPISTANEVPETGNTHTDEESDVIALDESDNDSDYSMPSLYGEVMGEVLKKEKRTKIEKSSIEMVLCVPPSSQGDGNDSDCSLPLLYDERTIAERNKSQRMTFQQLEEKYKCPYCDSDEQPLGAHIRWEHSKSRRKLLVCLYCPKKFRTPRDIYRHIIMCHEEPYGRPNDSTDEQ
ncbi:uncharacterized protein LOC131281737 [Anopheles ziemanni]|uniref:uncharacterized protein LOC131265465 n=1 Tax=Anopheles coustani TaxID=139045 RepID=UPI002658102C|nr:uncharacterized protein LOC131265465 [Anopheles coustani]XP_058123716.1 uncharacterized protein LOC131265465 [Anopheles coustani]XP_058167067.1 uncharacterized protein LOC131281737 [Anopheles ziemanni]